MEKEIARQLMHFSGVFLIFVAYMFGKYISFLISITLLFFLIFLYYSKKKKFKPFLFLIKFADKFERKTKDYRDAIYFFFSTSVIFLFFSQEIALISIFVLCVYDSIATLTGKFLGKKKIFFGKKSLEGAMCGFVITVFLGCYLFPFQKIFLATLIGAIAEIIPKINDNISIPFAVAFTLLLFDLF